MKNSNINAPSNKPPRHVQAALKKQSAVVALRQLLERQRIEGKEQLLQLSRDAAAETARSRKKDRERFREQEGIYASRLGRMVLNAMRLRGVNGVLLDARSVDSQWSLEDRDALALFLKPKSSDFDINLDDASYHTAQIRDAAKPTIQSADVTMEISELGKKS